MSYKINLQVNNEYLKHKQSIKFIRRYVNLKFIHGIHGKNNVICFLSELVKLHFQQKYNKQKILLSLISTCK